MEDGGNYGTMWFFVNPASINNTDFTVTIQKGIQVPTPDTYLDTTNSISNYLTVDRDWTFSFKKTGEGVADYTCTSVVAGAEPDYSDLCEETSVTGMRFWTAGSDQWCYVFFELSNFDMNLNHFNCYNNKSVYYRGMYNAFDKIYFDGDPTNTCEVAYGNASGRSYRTAIHTLGMGFPLGVNMNDVPFESVTIPAGTRFPSKIYMAGVTESDWSNANYVPKQADEHYFVTTSDVTLVCRDGVWMTEAKAEATDYANEFLTTLTCDNGVTAPSTMSRNALAADFESLSDDAKAILASATAKEDGDAIEKAVARYDYVIAKYGTASYSNFMGRTITTMAVNSPLELNGLNGNMSIILISVISVVSASLLALLILKRKKESK